MTRSPILVPLLAIAVLLAAVPLADSSVRRSNPLPASIEFALPANKGLSAHVENSSEGITLELKRGRYTVAYEVEGEATEERVRAQFGKLGRIDVKFEATETELDKPRGCTGPPNLLRHGRFVGTIEFVGEQEYVRIDASEVEGTSDVWRESEWHCPRHERAIRISGPPRLKGDAREARRPEMEPASLVALDRPCICSFAAFAERSRKGRGPTAFVGTKFEKREGMDISRVVYVRGAPSSFVFDHAAGTARVSPPPPFTGHATYKRRPHTRDLWRSTIQFPLLGSDPLSISGPDIQAKMVRDTPGGE